MTEAPVTMPAEPLSPDVALDPELEFLIRDALAALGLLSAANVVMQLSRLPIGHGVARSRVDSGRVDKRPLKRLRTTTSYLFVALLGDEAERTAMRRAVNRAHRDVRNLPDEPVPYNAFDRDLQLWVAACLYVGFEQVLNDFAGGLTDEQARTFYRHAARLGTTLQVREDQWPADREAFGRYWEDGLQHVRMDDTTRGYLQDLANLRFLPAPFPQLFGPAHRFVTQGFLPEPFRSELGLPWSARRQRLFDRTERLLIWSHRHLPARLKQLPGRLYERDVQRRIAAGRPIV
jgi:uncharacterized protein (DUF2236 family)